MSTSVKVYSLGGEPPPMLPQAWGDVVGAQQGQVIAFGWSKSDVNGMLTDRGLRQGTADYFTTKGRWIRGGWLHLGTPWLKVIQAGCIDVDDVGIYCAPLSMVKDSVVACVQLDGTAVPIARFGYDNRLGLYVEKEPPLTD